MAEVQLKDGASPTYSASIAALVGVTGDILTLAGVSGKVLRLTRLAFSGVATAAAMTDLTLVKRSTLDTGGTSTTPTVVPHNSGNGAGGGVVRAYTVAPTPGTAVGTIRAAKAQIGVAATAASAPLLEWLFGNRAAMCPTLIAANEQLCLNIGATNAGALYDIDIEWTEDNS